MGPRTRPAAGVATATSSVGHTLIELMVVIGVLGIALSIGIPNLWRASARLRLETAAADVVTALRRAQFHAFAHSEYVGLKFWTDEDPFRWGVYRDGDDDGIRTADIHSGVDSAVILGQAEGGLGPSIWFGIPTGLRPRDPSDPRRRLTRLHDPIRFGRSDIASFAHLGTASPGTVYLTNGRDLAAVRVTNRSGRVRVMHYDRDAEVWR